MDKTRSKRLCCAANVVTANEVREPDVKCESRNRLLELRPVRLPSGHPVREIGFLPVHGRLGSHSPLGVGPVGGQEVSKAPSRDSIHRMVKCRNPDSGHYSCFHPWDHDCTELLDGEFEEPPTLTCRFRAFESDPR